MTPEPIPPTPRSISAEKPPVDAEMRNFLIHLHLPAFFRALKLHGTGVKVRICGLLIMLTTVILTCIAFDSVRGDAGKTAALFSGLTGIVTGYLAYAFGAYISGCAEHHRSCLISAILNSPHVTAQEAREVIQSLERRIIEQRF